MLTSSHVLPSIPRVEKLGYDVPVWDLRCPGVTSISADVHKYGYSVKVKLPPPHPPPKKKTKPTNKRNID